MQIKKSIPNAITLLNLFCGSIAAVFAVNEQFVLAALFVFLGIFFDFFDGFIARKWNVQSAVGIQLDSLADMVTSGLVPGIVMYKLLTLASEKETIHEISWNLYGATEAFSIVPLALLGFCITLASAYRLAVFNVDEDQQMYFKGLPTPANALFILSFPLILEFQNSDALNAIILNKWFLIVITLISCYLLNSNLKLFALKFKNWSFKDNAIRYIFLILSIVFLIVFKFLAIPIIIFTYILLSIISNTTAS